ncbi:MAG: hypothetical protein KGZ79_01905 [Dethiobacter sp.]|jgi:NADH/NAD ratio-sensing transcriptional regulator Rex|nr:hypothetical protein [Dethiobacter sp.]
MAKRTIPGKVIKRLPLYLRILDEQVRYNVEIISSSEISENCIIRTWTLKFKV